MSGQARKGRALARLVHEGRVAPFGWRQHCSASFLPQARSSGCGSFWGKTQAVEDNDPPDIIYGKAEGLINKGDYGEAAKEYEEVDINHPYSQGGPTSHRHGGLRLLQGRQI